jgi:NADH-quinone oxidoreductase subunit E
MSVNELGTETKKTDAGTGAEQEARIISGTEHIFTGFKGQKSEAIPILQQVQQAFGYLPGAAMERIARFVKVPECTLFGVATFYAQFKLTPTGKNVIRVCRGTACHVKGGSRILKEVESRLGIKPGQNTPDMEYALETVACIGACALAPTMTINNDTHGEMTAKKVAELLPDKMEEKKNEEAK